MSVRFDPFSLNGSKKKNSFLRQIAINVKRKNTSKFADLGIYQTLHETLSCSPTLSTVFVIDLESIRFCF